MMPLGVAVCMVACHAGPAEHFAVFAKELANEGLKVEVYATGPALKKFQERGVAVHTFSLDELTSEEQDALAKEIAKTCKVASSVLTDVGHPFDGKVQRAFAEDASQVVRLAYYDNPEPYVPGGYSIVASNVMLAAQEILFANAHLANEPLWRAPDERVDLGDRRRIGIGYYPLEQARNIVDHRKTEHAKLRGYLFSKNNIIDRGQKVAVYFGGNNSVYFQKAFPAFLSMLDEADLSCFLIVLQQHPGAKKENLDARQLKGHEVILSDFNSDDAQIVADVALYFQTSMAAQFVLAGIPTIQIGHEPFQDILVKQRLVPSVTEASSLLSTLDCATKSPALESVLEGLGFKENWQQNLKQVWKSIT